MIYAVVLHGLYNLWLLSALHSPLPPLLRGVKSIAANVKGNIRGSRIFFFSPVFTPTNCVLVLDRCFHTVPQLKYVYCSCLGIFVFPFTSHTHPSSRHLQYSFCLQSQWSDSCNISLIVFGNLTLCCGEAVYLPLRLMKCMWVVFCCEVLILFWCKHGSRKPYTLTRNVCCFLAPLISRGFRSGVTH